MAALDCYNMCMQIISELVALVLALTLHEFAHALVGDALGDTTARREGRLTLNPAAHIDPFMTLLLPLMLILIGSPVVFGAAKPVPFNPWALRYGRWGAALVAAAGPATNFFIAAFFALWLRFAPGINVTTYQFLGSIIAVNVAFFVFNLIPFPPLDGSRILYAMVPASVREVMDRIEGMGMAAIFAIMIVSYLVLIPIITTVVRAIIAWLVPQVALP
jgi:Zn-dependent protease